jgi:hypothetical protein
MFDPSAPGVPLIRLGLEANNPLVGGSSLRVAADSLTLSFLPLPVYMNNKGRKIANTKDKDRVRVRLTRGRSVGRYGSAI